MTNPHFNLNLGLLAGMQVVVGFMLQVLVIRGIGDPIQTDTWVAAQTLPMVIFATLSFAFQGAWQTQFAHSLGDLPNWHAQQKSAHGQLAIVHLVLVGGLAAGAALWVPLCFPTFREGQLHQTIELSRLLLLGSIFNSHATLFLTALRGQDRFVVGEATLALGGILGLAATALTIPHFGIEAAVWITVIRLAATMLLLAHLCGWPGIAFGGTDGWKTIGMLLASNSIYKTTPIVDRYFGSQAAAGGLTLFNLAQTAISACSLVLDRSIVTPAVPNLSRLVRDREWPEVRNVYRRTLRLVMVPAVSALLMLLLLQPVWGALLKFTLNIDASTGNSWLVSLLLIGFLYPATCGGIVFGAFYALDEAKVPVRLGVIGYLLSLPAKGACFLLWGLPGLAAAVTTHYWMNFLFMHVALMRRLAFRIDSASTGEP